MKYVQRLLALTFCFIFSMCLIFLSRLNRETINEFKFGSDKYRCGRFPQESDIKYVKQLWQYVEVSKRTYRLANAFIDQNVLKITVTGPELDQVSDVMFCQVWFDDLPDTQPNVVRASDYLKFPKKDTGQWDDGSNYLYTLTCLLENEPRQPKHVSLTSNVCDNADNILEIKGSRPVVGVE